MKKFRVAIVLAIVFSIFISITAENNFFVSTVSETLGLGSRGSNVEEVQQRLKNWGYYTGEVDAKYGIKTFIAVMEYQRKTGLVPNGIAGVDTLASMGITTISRGGVAHAEGRGVGEEQLLARAINGEARGEPYEGQVAVGAVIINRTRNPKFPKTVAGVIYQPGAFTAVADGQINVPIKEGSTVVKAARDALQGWDPTNGCIYYWNPATATSKWIWTRKIVKKIGKHNFGN
ncbi:MAG: spore cortex-lytic enzyme [Clostridia bacterium]|nr:spore cortex-lytic enzyme [Clostridia bacterium]